MRVVLLLSLVVTGFAAYAFPADFYAANSVLATGKWVKIGVEKSGVYMIPTATLRSWGFTDPSKVRVHGYGGRRIADAMTREAYIDDLPAVASELTDAGVVFYAAGPDSWELIGSRYRGRLNPYASMGYYFVTEAQEAAPAVPRSGNPSVSNPVTTASARLHHERELMQATEIGPLFVGEDFRSRQSQTFKFSTPGRVAGTELWVGTQFVHRHIGASASLVISVGDESVSTSVSSTSDSHYIHASVSSSSLMFNNAPLDGFDLTLNYKPTRVVYQANLDYISVNYTRALDMPADGVMEFWSNRPQLSLGDDAGTARVWDVTDPTDIQQMETGRDGNRSQWSVSRSGMRSYVAWRPGAKLPQPTFVGEVASQNLHAQADPVDMVIFSTGGFRSVADRLADFHHDYDGMSVMVVDPAEVYNEFSSGVSDVSGIRKYLKMLYDRGEAAGHRLKYAVLMGRPTHDHRCLSASSPSPLATVPWWVDGDDSHAMNDEKGFGTDDFVAMLDDGSGGNMGLDVLRVAVGRIPLTSVAEGNQLVDKLEQYSRKSKKTGWKNHVLVLTDEGDNGAHITQGESLANIMLESEGQQHVFTKVFIGSYVRQNGTFPAARQEMYRALDDGVVWWCFAGHANNHSWTGDGMLTYTDLNNLYLRNVPFVVAATCDFLRWDCPVESGGEIMYKERNGGAIGMISATRPVYISENRYFLDAFARHAFDYDDDGRRATAGEVYRRLKNDIRTTGSSKPTSNTNRLRFVFMGDPAMRLATPDDVVELLTINGQPVDLDSQITIPALSSATFTGRVVAPDGTPRSSFDGVLHIDLYDALESRVSEEFDNSGKTLVYDVQGDKLFAGSAYVKNGEFSITVPMPSQVADNFRPAMVSMYAYATNSNDEAVGANREFYVYGFEEPETPDTTDPVIDSFVINHSGFRSGDAVNGSPMAIASVSDNVSINLSTAGVGQQMTLTLDETRTYTDVASFYTPAADGSPSGVINYPFEDLTAGAHTLRLRVFDTSGNVASQTIEFFVDDSLAPQIFDVYTDANPASESASFYVRHDRPENVMEVTITVYDLLGHPVWTATERGTSDMDVSSPVTWDLCDMAGRRVTRGIYLYRATVTTDNAHYETASRRIAVTAR